MILETTTRNALANAYDDTVNTGSGTATLKLETIGDVEVATLNLQNPAFGAAATGVITLQGVPIADSSATGGTIAQGSIYDRNGAKVSESPAGTSGTEIILSSLTVAVSETVTLTALTVTVPAS